MLGIEIRGTTKEHTGNTHLQHILNSPVKRLLAAYLQTYPYTYDHIAGFAQRLPYSTSELAPALEALTEKHVLIKLGHGTAALYALNICDGWQTTLNDYFRQHPGIPRRLTKLMSALL